MRKARAVRSCVLFCNNILSRSAELGIVGGNGSVKSSVIGCGHYKQLDCKSRYHNDGYAKAAFKTEFSTRP